MVFRTALCDVLGIEYPILQSGMGGIAGPELVAEVSRAGGLGILAGLSVPGEELRARIRRVRELTDRPFGVNLWLHGELRPPVPPRFPTTCYAPCRRRSTSSASVSAFLRRPGDRTRWPIWWTKRSR
jgi:NAD(P)H-dependent flavin oxidoreductase YrpB (nitropropane dioxygenase family)